MAAAKMHAGEVEVSLGLVRDLIAAQLPQWCDLSISPVKSSGTVNALYRLGDALCVRLPVVQGWSADTPGWLVS